jgi:amino acid permease
MPLISADQHRAVDNEQVLSRQLSATQQTTMALGGAIGTGLFLASGLSVNVAGPAIILSYVIVAVVSLLLGRALADMAVAHPTAGSFGVYAGIYLSPFAGYAVRVSYLLMEVIATGGQLVAASIYMAYWFPGVPGAVWVLAFAAMLLYVNTRTVRSSPAPLTVGNALETRHLTDFGGDLRVDMNASITQAYPFVGAIDELRLSSGARRHFEGIPGR